VKPTQTEEPPSIPQSAGIATVFPVPRQNALTPEQVRGANCVWCATPLTAAAFDLGRRHGSYMGVYGPWFPRACDSCTRAEASRVLHVHSGACVRCSRPVPAYCPDGEALRRLAKTEETG
jgi:hypothetical protein